MRSIQFRCALSCVFALVLFAAVFSPGSARAGFRPSPLPTPDYPPVPPPRDCDEESRQAFLSCSYPESGALDAALEDCYETCDFGTDLIAKWSCEEGCRDGYNQSIDSMDQMCNDVADAVQELCSIGEPIPTPAPYDPEDPYGDDEREGDIVPNPDDFASSPAEETVPSLDDVASATEAETDPTLDDTTVSAEEEAALAFDDGYWIVDEEPELVIEAIEPDEGEVWSEEE